MNHPPRRHSLSAVVLLLLLLLLLPLRLPATADAAREEAEKLHELAERLWAEGSTEAAAATFRRVLALAPDHLWARAGLAHLALARNDRAEALAGFLAAESIATGEEALEIRSAAIRATEGLLPDAERESFLREGIARHGPHPKLLDPFVSFMKSAARVGTLETELARLARESGDEAVAAARLALAAELGRDTVAQAAELHERHPASPAIATILFDQRLAAGDLAGAERVTRTLAAIHPEAALHLAARLAAKRGDPAAALAAAVAAYDAAANGDAAALLLQAAIAAGEDGRARTNAMRDFYAAKRETPEAAVDLLARALAAGRADFAQRFVNVVADLDPYGAVWPLLQARLHLHRGERDEALAVFERAVEAERPSFDLYLEMSSLLRDAGRTAENRLVLTRMFGLFPAADDRLALLARAIDHGETDFARAVYAALRGTVDEFRLRKVFYDRKPGALLALFADPAAPRDDPFLLLLEGETLAAIGRHEEAFARFDEALARSPGDRRVLLAIGKARMERSEFAEAEQALHAAAAPNDPETDLMLGRVRYLAGRYATARDALERAARGGGLTASLLLALGRTHLALADTRALADLLAAGAVAGLRLPGDLLDRLPGAEVERVDAAAHGMADLDRAVVRFRLGLVRQRRDDHAAALADFSAALAALPGCARLEALAAESLLALGRTDEALLAAGRALAAATDLPAAESRDAMLDSPYPCLTTVLAEAAILLGRFDEARHHLLAQVDGFRRGTSDLSTDPDIMRGDVTYLAAFRRRFSLAPPPAETDPAHAPSLRALEELLLRPGADALDRAEALLATGGDMPTATLYVRAYLEQERGRTAAAFDLLHEALARDERLASAAALAARILRDMK